MMKSIYFYSTVLIASLLMVVFVNLDIANAIGPKQERSAPRFMQQLNDEQKAEMESMIEDMKAAGATREEIHIAVKEKLEEFGIKPPERGDRIDGRGFRSPRHGGPMFQDQLNKEQRTAIREKVDELKDQGASREEIHQAVTQMLKAYGVEPPESGFERSRHGMRHGMHFPDINLSKEQREAIRDKVDAMHENDASREEIHDVVTQMLQDYGIEIPENLKRHHEMMKDLSEDQRNEVRKTVRTMRKDGASRDEIKEAVDQLFESYGIEINDPDPQQGDNEKEANLSIQNFPNPFNPETNIQYNLTSDGQVNLQIFDVQGKLVRSLLNEHQSAGTHTLRWDGLTQDGNQVPSGVYFLRISAGSETISKRIVLTK